MNQDKMGKFIAELRKQEGMTQKELAQKLEVSDKTVSKWECGNGIPDLTYLEPLCVSLHISVNELLSGERLSEQAYSQKAEANIMELMKENDLSRKKNRKQLLIGCALIVLMFGMIFYNFQQNGYQVLQFYCDPVGILIEAGFCFACVLISGQNSKIGILSVVQKIAIPCAVLIVTVEIVMVLHNLANPEMLGPSVAVLTLELLYAVIIYLVATIWKFRCEQ